jgi:hypothetical protein
VSLALLRLALLSLALLSLALVRLALLLPLQEFLEQGVRVIGACRRRAGGRWPMWFRGEVGLRAGLAGGAGWRADIVRTGGGVSLGARPWNARPWKAQRRQKRAEPGLPRGRVGRPLRSLERRRFRLHQIPTFAIVNGIIADTPMRPRAWRVGRRRQAIVGRDSGAICAEHNGGGEQAHQDGRAVCGYAFRHRAPPRREPPIFNPRYLHPDRTDVWRQ